ncbi:mast cell protease 1-like [Carettochelys insculpta]|uniref:mast cell protease 1-like n=1 Tax=Carettochelys insculpta TaxID=44489 RepID=UPI003EB9F06B
MGQLQCLLPYPSAHAGALRSQIVGGHEAKPHSRPYMAALKVFGDFSCGGFRVAPDWVMTAAHCMGNITVRLGAHNYHAPEASQQMFAVESYHLHPEYMVPYNDILLLKETGLSHKANLNKYVQVIPLPKSGNDLPVDTKCLVSGWGLIDAEVATKKLFETNAAVLSRRKCLMFYPALSSGMVCAASYHQLSDINFGDSGGPLVCNGEAQGIVSYGFQFPPSVYTRIAHYLPWIQKPMGQ